QQASNLLHRAELKSLASDEERIQGLYQIAFQRRADAEELKAAKKFIQSQAAAPAWPAEPLVWQYGWGAVDEKTKRTKQFQPLPHFTKYAWQGGTELPDAKLGWVLLNAEGGHPGNDPQHAAIRRWMAPRDGVVSVAAELEHPSDKGDGVRGRIVSSRAGALGEWIAFHQKTNTRIDRLEVRHGEMIDFVTDCRGSVEYDS